MTVTINGVVYGQMADAINPANLPAGMDAYLGYGDGRWPDAAQIQARFPGIKVYALTVYGSLTVGDGVDSEWGNATPAQAAAATQAELARGIVLPVAYCPQSWAAATVQAHQSLSIPRTRYRLLTAHYQGPTMPGAPTPTMHICGSICGCPVTADGTQWASYPAYDLSLLAPGFMTAPDYPGPRAPVTTTIGDNMQRTAIQVQIAAGQGWCYSPVPAASVVSVLVMDEAPAVVGGYDNIPSFAGIATDQNNPNGVLVFRGGADGVFGVTVISA